MAGGIRQKCVKNKPLGQQLISTHSDWRKIEVKQFLWMDISDTHIIPTDVGCLDYDRCFAT